MYRKIDNLGRVVIPKEARRVLNINDDDLLEIKVENRQRIVITKIIDTEEEIETEIERLKERLEEIRGQQR